jgi:two-component SAPR family response regulator
MAFILAGIGDIHRDRGAYTEALEAYEEGLKAARQSRENFIICYLLDAIGNTHRLMGDHTLAVSFVRQAYERARERDATYEMGLYQTSLGTIGYQQGNTRQAEEYLSQARDIFVHSDAKREVAKASLYLAQAYYVAGRFQEALDCVQAVLACLLELGYDQFLLPTARETKRVIEYAVARGMGDTLINHLLREADALVAIGSETSAQEDPAAIQPLLRVYALGENRVLRGDELVTSAEWGMAKSKELLFYLLCHKQRRKDQIGNDLWPELSPAKLRSSFHVALYRLRRALDQQDCVKYEDDQYFFNRRINYWFDMEEFEQSIHQAASAWATDRAKAARAYGDAVVLYSGDFLEDLVSSHEWCLFKREELLQQYLTALQRLGEYHAAQGDYREAIRFYAKVLEKDSYQEGVHREIMRCQAMMDERNAALKSYHRLAEFLEKEFGVDPAPQTTALYEQILQGKIGPG